jgi:hypothetical protein
MNFIARHGSMVALANAVIDYRANQAQPVLGHVALLITEEDRCKQWFRTLIYEAGKSSMSHGPSTT